MHGLPRQRGIAKQLLGVRTQSLPGGRQLQMGAHPFKYSNAERILERLDARADGRLAHAQRAGGAVKSAVGDDRQESFELVEFHRTPSTFRQSNRSVPCAAATV